MQTNFTTIDRDILKDRRVKGICLFNGKRVVVPLERHMEDYIDIAVTATRTIEKAFHYMPFVKNEHGIQYF